MPYETGIEPPRELQLPGIEVTLAITCLAVFSTALAYILYFRILQKAGATNLLLVTLLIPVTAIILGSTILGETLQPSQLLGIVIIGLGLLAIDGRLFSIGSLSPRSH